VFPFDHKRLKSNGFRVTGRELQRELQGWLDQAVFPDLPVPSSHVRAVIAPHAGFTYSGPTAAYAYKTVDTTKVKRVFILGPSHKFYLEGCALSNCSKYETPLGSMKIDREVMDELEQSLARYSKMTLAADEDEHSLEMHLPFVQMIMQG
jgi:AmmeMemoRadiSam system protein B